MDRSSIALPATRGSGGGTGTRKIDPDVCSLVVVDIQNDFCSPEGKLGRRGADMRPCATMVRDHLAPLIDAARDAGVPVVWIRTVHDESTDSDAWLARRGMALDPPADRRHETNCATGTWGAEFFHVAPEPGELVVTKSRYSAFAGTDLEGLLRATGRPSLLFTGVLTDACVDSTLREALSRDFHVCLVEDCCVGSDPAAHEATIRNVRRRFGPVVDSRLVAGSWREGRA